MRDAIVFSGTIWESCNVLERFSTALSMNGLRVLYCENPVSRIKNQKPRTEGIEPNIVRLRPEIWGHRLNQIPVLARMQSRMAARQMLSAAKEMRFQRSLFIYSYMGRMLPLVRIMKDNGSFLIHICMDYPEPELAEHSSLADQTMVIPSAGFQDLRVTLGDRVILLPQLGPPSRNGTSVQSADADPETLRAIPRPRLAYLGIPQDRLAVSLLREVLVAMPDWHFVFFGPASYLNLPNAHALPWMPFTEITRIAAASDLGFMPYDCDDARQYNSVPLKLLDHFALGMPVVSTPIASLLEHSSIAYLGKTSGELIRAVEDALREPPESPKRIARKQFAEEHSLRNIATFLSKVLPLQD